MKLEKWLVGKEEVANILKTVGVEVDFEVNKIYCVDDNQLDELITKIENQIDFEVADELNDYTVVDYRHNNERELNYLLKIFDNKKDVIKYYKGDGFKLSFKEFLEDVYKKIENKDLFIKNQYEQE